MDVLDHNTQASCLLKYFLDALSSAQLIRARTNQKSSEAGQPLWASVYSRKLPWQLFYLQ